MRRLTNFELRLEIAKKNSIQLWRRTITTIFYASVARLRVERDRPSVLRRLREATELFEQLVVVSANDCLLQDFTLQAEDLLQLSR